MSKYADDINEKLAIKMQLSTLERRVTALEVAGKQAAATERIAAHLVGEHGFDAIAAAMAAKDIVRLLP